ncbi:MULTISPECIES: hypothetical protein [Rheinheimera]|uniref:Uncharacterized protein n=1 Tax=Rheinheimera marina TaxID=1774958 RepID=A0ABV9JH81_9GAMM
MLSVRTAAAKTKSAVNSRNLLRCSIYHSDDKNPEASTIWRRCDIWGAAWLFFAQTDDEPAEEQCETINGVDFCYQ